MAFVLDPSGHNLHFPLPTTSTLPLPVCVFIPASSRTLFGCVMSTAASQGFLHRSKLFSLVKSTLGNRLRLVSALSGEMQLKGGLAHSCLTCYCKGTANYLPTSLPEPAGERQRERESVLPLGFGAERLRSFFFLFVTAF